MRTRPRVSVVIPTYNRGYAIGDAIKSILGQTFGDWELLIVDDGSTDDTRKVVKSFKDKRIRYYPLEHTGIVSAVRNYGTKRAKTNIIVVQDSDDISYPTRLEKIYKYFEKHPGVDIVYHPLKMIRDGLESICGDGEFKRLRILHEQYLPGACAYLKTAWRKHPYDEQLIYGDDALWHLHHCLDGATYGKIDEVLYEYRLRGDSDSDTGFTDGRAKQMADRIAEVLLKDYGLKINIQLTNQ